MDEKRSLQRKSKHKIRIEKVNTRDELVARIMYSATLIKQERQDDLRRTKCTIAKRAEKCIEFDGGIFENLL
jgi:cob(I)alamin adenosyltransferase